MKNVKDVHSLWAANLEANLKTRKDFKMSGTGKKRNFSTTLAVLATGISIEIPKPAPVQEEKEPVTPTSEKKKQKSEKRKIPKKKGIQTPTPTESTDPDTKVLEKTENS